MPFYEPRKLKPMDLKDIKTSKDAKQYLRNCINDFEEGTPKNKTIQNLMDYTHHMMGLARHTKQEKRREIECVATRFLEIT